MLLSFEMANVGDLVFDMAGTSLTSRKAQGTSVLRESNEHGKRGNGGSPGTWEVLSFPRRIGRRGWRTCKPLAPGLWVLGPWERREDATVVPPSEGNGLRRDGRQEVVAP